MCPSRLRGKDGVRSLRYKSTSLILISTELSFLNVILMSTRQRKLITWKLLWAPLPGFVGRLATSHNKRCSKRNVPPVGADGFSGRNYQFLKKGDGTGRRMLHPILTATQPAFGFSLRKTARGVPALSQSYKCSINLMFMNISKTNNTTHKHL